MKYVSRHFCFFVFFLCLCFCLGGPSVSEARFLKELDNFSYIPSRQNAVLRFSNISSGYRFTFDFPSESKIAYEIRQEKDKTIITFSRLFRLDTLNLTDFPQYMEITQRQLPSHQLEITFPLSLMSSTEHLNSIILDFSAQAQNSNPPKNIKPLQISSLSFSWNTPVALAVFKRDKYLWIVFNQYQQVNIEELLKNAGDMVKDILQMPHNTATILRVEARDELFSEVRKEGLLWVVDLYNKKTQRQQQPIKIITDETIKDKPFLQINLPHTEDLFSFLDPEVGDMLMAVTSSETGHALFDGYKYADFELLPSSQGIGINSDDFGIGLIRNADGFMLQTLNHPLNISKNLDIIKREARSAIQSSGLSLAQELSVPIIRKNFADSEKFLKTQISIAHDAEKNKFRYELARFYLSYGLASNAYGVLRDIKKDLLLQKKEIPQRLSLLFGMANFVLKRYDLAFDSFNKSEFAKHPEISLWRYLADTDRHRDHSPTLLKDIHFIHDYPTDIKKTLALRGAYYAALRNNDLLLQRFIELLKELPMDSELSAALDYFEAEKVRMQGYFRSALPQYKLAALSSSNRYSALARFRIADFNSRVADIKQNRTIQELERLRFSWGEKNFKLEVLDKLVDLYLKTNNFYLALKNLDTIGKLSVAQKPLIEQRMIQIMEEIYYYNNDNQFSPIKALALFDDYGYLIKRSPHQTAIIIKLADRLVAVDLLNRAYNLLDTYLKENRQLLSEQKISAMGGRMALINMFQQDEETALQNLENTHYENISSTLKLQRRIIEAQAYAQKGLPEKALALLGDNLSKNALLLKADIYWKTEQWDKASETLRYLVEKPKVDQPLSEEQIRYILDWLTALKQAGKETVIVRVRNTFLPYFEETPYISIFNILTDFLENDKISLKDVDHTIQNVQAFSNFAKQYTKSLMSETVSEENASNQ